jgi:hypothetical protein
MTYRSDKSHGLGADACLSGADLCVGINVTPQPIQDPSSGWFAGSGGGILGGTNIGIPTALVGFSWLTLALLGAGIYIFLKVTE